MSSGRSEMVGLRVTKGRKREIETLAEIRNEGVVADLLRDRIFPWVTRELAAALVEGERDDAGLEPESPRV